MEQHESYASPKKGGSIGEIDTSYPYKQTLCSLPMNIQNLTSGQK
jgi:hypothetical protein